MPTRSPEEQDRSVSPWRFPYLNPNRPPFNHHLANLAEGERREIPRGSLGGFMQWGISVARGLAWPPRAPITAHGQSLSGSVGPASVTYPPANLRLRAPSRTLSLPGGGSVTLGGQLYGRFEWRGLNSVSTLGYETTWSVSLPAAGELPSETFPATTGAVGGYVKVAPVRVLAATVVATVVAGGVYALWWLLGPAGPLVVPVPVP